MSGRGRGGRGGRGGISKSFNREQLNAMGIVGNEMQPGPATQPPPLYPILDHRPVPLIPSIEVDYLLLLKQVFIDHIQLSPSYIKMPEAKNQLHSQEIDKLVAQIPNAKENYDWKLFPSELRPKLVPKRVRTVVKKDVDVEQTLKNLEKLEETTNPETVVKQVEAEETNEFEPEEEEQDEEMDDGTDYASNYFDNGEDYEDDDDNLDDGPIF